MAKSFIERLRTINGANPGTYYTIPRDRAAVAAAETSPVPMSAVLEYSDVPTEAMAGMPALDGDSATLYRFHSVRAVENAVRVSTLGTNGLPLKSPRLFAHVIAYPTHAAAVEANDGDVDGVESIDLPWGLPVGFDYPEKRVLVLRDARYLEFNPLRVPEPEIGLTNVQTAWTFLDQVRSVQERFRLLEEGGLLNPSAWSSDAVVDSVDREFEVIASMMRVALKPFDESLTHLDAEALKTFSGIKPSAFDTYFGSSFIRQLDLFREELHPAVKAKKAEQAITLQAGVKEMLDAVRRRSARGERQDAGEKIGGARKDYAKFALAVHELASMSEREMFDHVKKDNVWPKPDFAAMRERGVTPEIAFLIREYRRAFPVSPSKGGYNVKDYALKARAQRGIKLDEYTNFVRAGALLHEKLSQVTSYAELVAAVKEIREEGGLGNSYLWNESWFCDGAGYRLVTRSFAPPEHHNQIERALRIARATVNGGWDWALKRRDEVADADSEPTAEATGRTKPKRPEPEVEHLKNIVRRGSDRRAGVDCTETMLMEAFGLRAVEYGNWLPQGERQVVLNHAYDAFCDLADCLGLERRAMGLGGRLAVAFGSRGTGGKAAAVAHFEPGRFALNLTRMRGAGSMAHEWFHAFDYWLAQYRQLSQIEPVSSLNERRFVEGTPEHRLGRLVNGLMTQYETKDAMLHRLARTPSAMHGTVEGTVAEYYSQRLSMFLSRIGQMLPSDQHRVAFKAYTDSLLTSHLKDVPALVEYGVKTFEDPLGFARTVQGYVDSLIGDAWHETVSMSNVRGTARSLEQHANWVLRMQSEYHSQSSPVLSSMLRGANYFDGFRKKPYWSTRVEMAARAFEGFVQDTIERDGEALSQYLVHGTLPSAEAEHVVYPRGEERGRARVEFRAFFDAVALELRGALAPRPVGPNESHATVGP